ncbi:NmrA family NAD(P)-binding protein [Nakamurella sp. A5-74]|uniref:NmrA family NAD(P)-binding protein n=1 Tax=Nakamurella sp. A5-74 TaxID=3158264 RepID=A0AAU8DI87_9ACTN
MILVTAAAGNQGRQLIPKLVRSGEQVRACVQSEASARRLRSAGVSEVLIGDLGDPRVQVEAVRGVRSVYHVGPTAHPLERRMGMGLVDAAREAGVGHFVFSSVLHAITTDLVQHEIKRDVEEHLLSSGLEFTILQPSNYMLPLKLKPAFERGVFELSWSLSRRQSLVDLADVADVARLVLTDAAAHVGATYELAGPGRYTAHELGAIISSVLGQPIEVREIDADTYLAAWFGDADPAAFPHQARMLRAISTRYSSHDFVGNPNVLNWLLRRAPTTFEQYVRRELEQFRTDNPTAAPGESP